MGKQGLYANIHAAQAYPWVAVRKCVSKRQARQLPRTLNDLFKTAKKNEIYYRIWYPPGHGTEAWLLHAPFVNVENNLWVHRL